ncbi:MAG: glycosyltransferase [Gemmatimonadaceae bacterium]
MTLRVLVLTPIYPWPGDPPEGIFVHRQIRNLVRQGVQCRVINYHPALRYFPASVAAFSWLRYHPRWLTWPNKQDGVAVAHVFYPRRVKGEDVVPAIGQTLARFIESSPEYQQTDLVYAHWLWTGGAAALHLRERFGWPVAAIARGSEMHDWHSMHPFCRPHVERVLTRADLVLANCEGLRRRAVELSSRTQDQCEVVYNGCDAQAFSPSVDRIAVRRALGLPVHGRLLLCCASIIQRKGIAELIDAWRAFSPRRREWRLVLVGRLVRQDLLQRLQSVGQGRIIIVGRVAADRVRHYMQAADAYIQPSLLEGLANATMEAMATGLPVIATDTGGQREVVRSEQNGWLVPPGDSDALATAMESMAGNMNEARRRGAEARQTIQSAFDPLIHANRLRALLEGLVRQGSRAPVAAMSERSPARPAGLASGIVSVA